MIIDQYAYSKAIIVAKINNKKKTHCNYGHTLPTNRICIICQKRRGHDRNIKLRTEKERLEKSKFKFFGIGNK